MRMGFEHISAQRLTLDQSLVLESTQSCADLKAILRLRIVAISIQIAAIPVGARRVQIPFAANFADIPRADKSL